MTRDQILATLRRHEAELRHRGVAHLSLFGSQARGDTHEASDIDLLVELGDSPLDLFGYIAMTQYLEALFPVPVDVANRKRLKPYVRQRVEQEALSVF